MEQRKGQVIVSIEENELWKDIPGYEGYYSASSLGRIRREDGYYSTKKGKIISLSKDNIGYLRCDLSKNNTRKTIRVHKVIALSFLGESNNNQVNHKDGNKTNNNLSNLEYISAKDNTRHAMLMKGGVWGRKPKNRL